MDRQANRHVARIARINRDHGANVATLAGQAHLARPIFGAQRCWDGTRLRTCATLTVATCAVPKPSSMHGMPMATMKRSKSPSDLSKRG